MNQTSKNQDEADKLDKPKCQSEMNKTSLKSLNGTKAVESDLTK